MPRKSQDQRDEEHRTAEYRVWDAFRPRLEALQSYAEALQLAHETPPPDAPGRKYYSNLAFFLQEFGVPSGSSYEERELYLKFIQRIDAAGMLKPGAGVLIVQRIREAVERQQRGE